MVALQNSFRGISLMVELNLDRVINLVTIIIALLAGAYIGSL